MSDAHDTISEASRELISFRVAGQDYCLDIMVVREIRGWTPATAIPHAPQYVRGVVNLRGAVVPVVDLAARLGLPAPEPCARHVIIITQRGTQTVGLLVESVSDILSISPESVQPTPEIASEEARAFVTGVIATDERLIRMIDLERTLPPSTREAA